MAAGVEAAAEVAATEPKMEEESGAPGVPSGNGAPGPKGEGERPAQNEKRKEKNIKRGGNRFEPYANPTKRYRAFITNIPFDVKWQSLKDLVKEKVGEVTYVELLMDAEGKSRGCAVVEFKMEESMKKAAEVLNKHSLSGRPLKVKEDPDGEHARRAMQKVMATTGGMGMGPGGPGMINIPPSILNNPNIPNEIIHALQAGRLGSTVFVANLDYKVGWKKLKEVFSMAGVVVRADILEDKDGKSRGIGTVTFEQSIEAVQAISMFNGQLLFDRPMHVKMDERALPKGDFFPPERPQQLPRMEGPFGGGMENMGRFGSGMNMGRINGGGGGSVPGIERMGPGIDRIGGAGMERMGAGLGHGMDRVGSEIERMGLVMDRMGSVERMGSGIERMGPLGLDHMASSIERMGQTMERIGSGVERMGAGMGFGLERMAAPIDRVGQTIERMGSGVERMGPAIERMGLSMERMVPAGMGAGLERMGPVMDRMATGLERMGANNLERMGLERMGANSLERMGLERMGANSLERMGPAMGPALGAGIERMGLAMGGGGGASFDRAIEMERGNFGGSFAGSFGGAGGHAPGVARKACQIFVRNLPFDFTWKMLKDKFNECGHVLYADIKMENGKSKGCGVVKFESPEVAERACRMMNGMKLSGREIDVRIDRNA
ncbi:heterogeneous nuclear ribonucleoprotein M isoform X18 [Camelus ferus]|uniref:Heterogeneous nuclear ribonucleoprotein M n=1 Tax=Camelus ferus TaxID=419612 RepID=A0A8B8RXL1_CAMFR|nr:heterogeneous nuclear ribonucleoprotein M isoform X17 [Camelus dromedarius]XP_031545707.1 heterogeneous nuclear ribonucleoprotein M isoform X17 [Vicugna pacos]XP_032322175.1 heterogeneous nuclear ribonucleoprotein M isoform X18 [Camelus ferus]